MHFLYKYKEITWKIYTEQETLKIDKFGENKPSSTNPERNWKPPAPPFRKRNWWWNWKTRWKPNSKRKIADMKHEIEKLAKKTRSKFNQT